jgi:hypothetical protein
MGQSMIIRATTVLVPWVISIGISSGLTSKCLMVQFGLGDTALAGASTCIGIPLWRSRAKLLYSLSSAAIKLYTGCGRTRGLGTVGLISPKNTKPNARKAKTFANTLVRLRLCKW